MVRVVSRICCDWKNRLRVISDEGMEECDVFGHIIIRLTDTQSKSADAIDRQTDDLNGIE